MFKYFRCGQSRHCYPLQSNKFCKEPKIGEPVLEFEIIGIQFLVTMNDSASTWLTIRTFYFCNLRIILYYLSSVSTDLFDQNRDADTTQPVSTTRPVLVTTFTLRQRIDSNKPQCISEYNLLMSTSRPPRLAAGSQLTISYRII